MSKKKLNKKTLSTTKKTNTSGIHGNSDYKPEYDQKIIDYFYEELKAGGYPTFNMFAHNIGVHVDTLHEWKKTHVSFSESYKKAKGLQEHLLQENGLTNKFNPTITIFCLKNNHGWKDKVEVSGDKENPVAVEHGISKTLTDKLNSLFGDDDGAN